MITTQTRTEYDQKLFGITLDVHDLTDHHLLRIVPMCKMADP